MYLTPPRPTVVAQTSAGPIAAYRDQQAGEIRDISVVRFVDGRWTSPRPVHRDGWRIHSCPPTVRNSRRTPVGAASPGRTSGMPQMVRAQASWRVGPGDVTLRGRNLTNTFYVDWAPTANQMLIGMPRVVEMAYQFTF